MKSIAVLTTVAGVAVAQAVIPTGVATGCSTFLTKLNTDSTVQACLKPLTAATSAYTAAQSTPASLAAVKASLQSVCATSTCKASDLGGKLAEFWTACSTDLTASTKNADLIRTYDILYTLAPFTAALCTKDESGNFCATKVSLAAPSKGSAGVNNAASSGSSVIAPEDVSQYLATSLDSKKRAVTMVANTTTFQNSNLPFLFLSADLDKEALCTTCAKNIITSYTTFEQSVPYGPGLALSSLLKGRTSIWGAMKEKCDATFITGENGAQAVGAVKEGILGGSSAAQTIVPGFVAAFVAAAFAAVTL